MGVHQCKNTWKLHVTGNAQYLKHWLKFNSAKHQKNCSRLNKVYSHLYQQQPFTWILPWVLRDFLEQFFLYYINNQQNSCSKKSRKFHGKTPLLESLFNKATCLRPVILLKSHFSTAVFLWILTLQHLWTTS